MQMKTNRIKELLKQNAYKGIIKMYWRYNYKRCRARCTRSKIENEYEISIREIII